MVASLVNDAAIVSAAFPGFFTTVAFVMGLCVGSFLNVVALRLPQGQSLILPGSHCACGTPIAWYDNIPVLSWFVLRGRARCCGRRFSIRYAFIELLTGVVFAFCWRQFPPELAFIAAFFLSVLIAAALIDFDHLLIPDMMTIGLCVAGILASVIYPALHQEHGAAFGLASVRAIVRSIEGLLVGSSVLLWLAVLAETALKKDAVGFGDVKFVGAIGAFCGIKGAIFAIFAGALIGAIWCGLGLLLNRITGTSRNAGLQVTTPAGVPTTPVFGAHVPFGPMLALASGVFVLFARPWVDEYVSAVAFLF